MSVVGNRNGLCCRWSPLPMTIDSDGRHVEPAIGDYGVVGDSGSIALISRWGEVDWLCWPSFDSPSLFAALLDRQVGGSFALCARGGHPERRAYVPGTNVLDTFLRSPTGLLRVRDLMPVAPRAEQGGLTPEHALLREAECLEGEVELELRCDPRFDYGRGGGRAQDRGAHGIFWTWRDQVLVLRSQVPLRLRAGGADGAARLRAGERRLTWLSFDMQEPATLPPLGERAQGEIRRTIGYWRDWSATCRYAGPHEEAVRRSALVLRLLSDASTGSFVAAATASLPEKPGGVRNWDYRYCWLRDAAFALRALFDLGFEAEGKAFLSWLLYTTRRTCPRLRVLYSIFGGEPRPESELEHLAGYRGSRPVRIGNEAGEQLQLDLYGHLVASADEFCRRGGELDRWQAKMFVTFGEWIRENWRLPDKGIWEVRSPRRHLTHSKLMCWVALQRLLDMEERGILDVPRKKFEAARDEIRQEVERRGFSERLGSYTSTFDREDVDASLLQIGIHGFSDPNGPRMRGTLELLWERLGQGAMLRRYGDDWEDGLPPGEGAFGICGFWAVELLARRGDLDQAEELFEGALRLANDLGLFGEEMDPDTGDPLGNFPQAFTHIGLINAAVTLHEQRRRREGGAYEDEPRFGGCPEEGEQREQVSGEAR